MQIDKSIILKNAYLVYNHKKNNPFVALKDFNYEFDQGKIYCIIGESGSGKSTLISLFNGLNRLTYGDINICGIDITSNKNLNNSIVNYKLINEKSIIEKILEYKNNKKYALIQFTKDSNYYDIQNTVLILNGNVRTCFKKLNSKNSRICSIKPNIKNIYLVELDNIEYLENQKHLAIDDFSNSNQRIKIKDQKTTRKIKKYKDLRRRIGVVSQFPEFQLFKSTVIDDVSFGPKTLGISKKDSIENAKKELNKLGIKESHYYNSPFELSGGQKRRVAIAGILAINSSTLIFDEPTAGLDPVGEREMINIIKESKKNNKTIFVVTHSMEQVLEIADEILVIHNGELIDSGDPYKIFNSKEILDATNIETPYIIQMVNSLSNKNKKYKKLLELKPRTIEELADYIYKIKKGGK